MSKIARPRGLFVAVDTPGRDRAAHIIADVNGAAHGVKLGLEFFSALGPSEVQAALQEIDLPLFLDLKFHDIPNTVAGAVAAVVRATRPRILTVHASGGPAMMRAAQAAGVEAAAAVGVPPPAIVAVTALTSLDGDDLARIGQIGPVPDLVRRLASLALECGLDGVVCSPREVAMLRRDLGPAPLLVVPGIRPAWTPGDASGGDQKRVMTPAEARAAGADVLVVGRPVTGAADRRAAARRIVEEIEGDD